jgi:hypothetical protein
VPCQWIPVPFTTPSLPWEFQKVLNAESQFIPQKKKQKKYPAPLENALELSTMPTFFFFFFLFDEYEIQLKTETQNIQTYEPFYTSSTYLPFITLL